MSIVKAPGVWMGGGMNEKGIQKEKNRDRIHHYVALAGLEFDM